MSTVPASQADIRTIVAPPIINNIEAFEFSPQQKEINERIISFSKTPLSYVKKQNFQFNIGGEGVDNKVRLNDGLSAGGATPPQIHALLFLAALEERSNAFENRNNRIIKGIWAPPYNQSSPLALKKQSIDEKTAIATLGRAAQSSRLSGYAYVFGRTQGGQADALGARYGGSQIAVQAAYRLNPNKKTVWDASVRLQSALNEGDKEIAVGVRAKPNKKFPITVIAERRFRPSNSDGFALYAAGGKSDIALAANISVNFYAQAGVSTAAEDTLFFDANANVEHTVYNNKNIHISAGGGAWAGGQRGAQRLDIGPSVHVKFSSGKRNYRLSGDWRERIDGNASPTSGAAITLSTDF